MRLRVDLRAPASNEPRFSAYASRLRKKLLIEELQKKVSAMTGSSKSLRDENRTLLLQLEEALAENRRLRFMQHQSLLRGSPALPLPAAALFPGLVGAANWVPPSKMHNIDPKAGLLNPKLKHGTLAGF